MPVLEEASIIAIFKEPDSDTAVIRKVMSLPQWVNDEEFTQISESIVYDMTNNLRVCEHDDIFAVFLARCDGQLNVFRTLEPGPLFTDVIEERFNEAFDATREDIAYWVLSRPAEAIAEKIVNTFCACLKSGIVNTAF